MVAIDSDIQGYNEAERLLSEGIDLVCGGFPCQDISAAGKGAGITGSRSGLWREMLRTIRLVRPKFAIVENVAALLGRGMGTVLGDLAESGYDAEWDCISAADVGAPHLRKRIWIVAHSNGPRLAERILHDRVSESTGRTTTGEVTVMGGENVADSDGQRQQQPQGAIAEIRGRAGDGGEALPHPDGQRFQKFHLTAFPNRARLADRRRNEGRRQWAVEPDVGRVANGVPNRVDRLKSLGNSVVPQIVQLIGERLK